MTDRQVNMRLGRLGLLAHMIFLSGFSIEQLFLLGIVTNWLFYEPRPVVGVVEDVSITHHISKKLSDDPRYDQTTHVIPISYDQMVLLAGQVPNEALKQQAFDYATNTPKVKRVFNQITISTPMGAWRQVQDTLLTGVLRVKLLMTSNLHYHHFRITTVNGEVFILGKADANEANLAALSIQKTTGVRQVIKLVTPA